MLHEVRIFYHCLFIWQVLEAGVRYCSLLLELAIFHVLGTLPSCNCTLKPHKIITAVCYNPAMTALRCCIGRGYDGDYVY